MPSINRQLFSDAESLRVRDVTLHATDDVQTHREKLARIMLNELYEFVGLLDANGTTLEINRAALDGAGIELDEIRGRPFWEARWWATTKEVQNEQREVIRRASEGEFVRRDFEIYGQQGGQETILIDYSLLPIKDRTGKIVFLLPEGRNITDKKRAEDEIARKNRELQILLDKIQRLDNAKTDFFANVSHELRTPLALILGPSESLLAKSENLSDVQRRDLEVIQRNAAILMKHVNDLLDLAKLDAGKMGMRRARVDLAVEVRTIAAHFEALAAERSLSYVVETPSALDAEVDQEKFERILLNLLSNAFKFTPDSGRIRCALELGGELRAVLLVEDNGCGVSPDLRDKIFERFHQAQGGTTRDFGGTGLGLAIAKEFVDLHGGTIEVLDAPGGGARFQIELPLQAPADAYGGPVELLAGTRGRGHIVGTIEELQRAEFGATPDLSASDKPIILVAEDNVDMRRFITEILADENRVVSVGDGAQALEQAKSQPPDLIVTDLMMPKLGGDRLVAELRSTPSLAQVPIIVLSAKADESLRLKLLSESVQDYVVKPFSSHELRVRVRNLVTMKRAREALQKELATQNEDLSQLTRQLIAHRQSLQRSHDALKESEQRWRAVYENTAVGVLLTDLHGRVLAANPALQQILGYSESELSNVPAILTQSDTATEERHSQVAKLADASLVELMQQRQYLHRDGSVIWANVRESLIPGTESMPPTLITVVEDITKRKLAEQDLAQARTELARASRVTTMGELAASIAHEVNQPLAAVVANGQACLRWLASEPRNDLEVREAVRRIVRDANRAGEVIARIRGFLKRGRADLTRFFIADVIDEAVGMVRETLRSAGITLNRRFDPGLPCVLADRVQIQQVTLNLVMNSIEAMATANVFDRRIELRVERQGPNVSVAVSDTGPGIALNDFDRIFEAFYTTKPDGMGMGLAIGRSIIESHGGRLWASANGGPGSTLQFTLPISGSSES
jgi:PAS domain S-box-containing protein